MDATGAESIEASVKDHYDHSEGVAHVCIVYRAKDILCSASSAISGDAAEGGARISNMYSIDIFKHINGEIWGTNPHPSIYVVL